MEIIGYGILLAIGFAIAPAVIISVLTIIAAVLASIVNIFGSK